MANTADDWWLHGLKVCPDLDTVMYTLGERHRHRARLGAPRRDLERPRRAGGVRRRAGVVRPRRPRPGHAPGADPDARRGLPAVGGHRRTVPALAAGRGAAADDRRPGRDPRRDRRPRHRGAAGGALPGVLGAPPRRGPRARRRRRSAWRTPPPAPACWRRSRAPTSCWCRPPTRSSPSAPSSACPGLREALATTPRPGGRRLGDHRRGPRPRHGAPAARRRGRGGLRRRRRRALRPPRGQRQRRCPGRPGRLAGRHRRREGRRSGCGRSAWRAAPCRCG